MPKVHLLSPPKPSDPKSFPASASPNQAASKAPVMGAVARLYWMLVGNAALYLIALAIVEKGRDGAWTTDVAFWAVVVSLMLVRYVDIALLSGATASGKPASLRDWSRYMGRLLLFASVVWIVAHAVALMR